MNARIFYIYSLHKKHKWYLQKKIEVYSPLVPHWNMWHRHRLESMIFELQVNLTFSIIYLSTFGFEKLYKLSLSLSLIRIVTASQTIYLFEVIFLSSIFFLSVNMNFMGFCFVQLLFFIVYASIVALRFWNKSPFQQLSWKYFKTMYFFSLKAQKRLNHPYHIHYFRVFFIY